MNCDIAIAGGKNDEQMSTGVLMTQNQIYLYFDRVSHIVLVPPSAGQY